MKILWLCPIMLPEFADHFHEKRNPKGGWITGSFESLRDSVDIDICCPARECEKWDRNIVNGTTIYTWKRTDNLTETFREILISCRPDIVQIFGTEKKMTLDMVNAAEQEGMLDNTVIIIQGNMSVTGRYHFFCHLPYEIIMAESPAEYKYKVSLRNQRDAVALQGSYERDALRKARHVVGRTKWDEACVRQINPHVRYYRCYESLRSSFYEEKWEYDSCEKYSIFISQSHFPVKGFHLALEAMLLGMPVVSSYVGGISDFIQHEKNGYLYQSDAPYMLAHYICKVFEDSAKAAEMGMNARESIRKILNREANAGRMKEIYATILNAEKKD